MGDESSRSLVAKCHFCGKLNRVEAARRSSRSGMGKRLGDMLVWLTGA